MNARERPTRRQLEVLRAYVRAGSRRGDVERLIAQAQRRLATCFACGADGAFPATITSSRATPTERR